ncbi:MAG TPA: cytochrome c oxidase assembly protein [Xanthobacteraceae bacterium]
MSALLAILLLGAAAPALAHGDLGDVIGANAAWTYDPWVIVPLYASALLFLFGTVRLWRHAGHGRGMARWQVACFWTGWTALALALISPLHWLGERLFTAHMIEHGIIMAVAAPLLAVARPVGAFLWALPMRARRALGRLSQTRAVASVWRAATDPLIATLVHGAALWAWHLPGLYNTVLTSIVMHRLQHASFVVTALLFWWSLFYGRAGLRGYGAAVFYLFVTTLHSGVLGLVIALSPKLLFPQQVAFAADWGLTPREDQQLAGLVMWVPMGFIYTAAALYFAACWITGARSQWQGARHAPLAG